MGVYRSRVSPRSPDDYIIGELKRMSVVPARLFEVRTFMQSAALVKLGSKQTCGGAALHSELSATLRRCPDDRCQPKPDF